NLLSVLRFVYDNHCILMFTPFECIVKDLASGHLLYRGPTDGRLYPIIFSNFPQSPLAALLCTKASSSLWHKRMGHPFSITVQHIISHYRLPLSGSSAHPSICQECQLGKSSKLPF
ncbi:PREDICTED: Retrovirus-related Pol poly from transposon, partial [Prunus dulcis]